MKWKCIYLSFLCASSGFHYGHGRPCYQGGKREEESPLLPFQIWQSNMLAGRLATYVQVQVEKIATPKPGKSLVFHLLRRRRRRREIERKVGMQLRGSQKGKEERKGIFLLFCTLLLLSPFCGRVGARLAKVRQRREGPLKTPRGGQKRGRGNSPIVFLREKVCETAVSSRLE